MLGFRGQKYHVCNTVDMRTGYRNLELKYIQLGSMRSIRKAKIITLPLCIVGKRHGFNLLKINPLNPELNPICYLLALLGAHHFLHVSRIRVKLLTFRLLMSYIYGAPILDVSRSHTTTQHSR